MLVEVPTEMDRVSIVIPCYNPGKFLLEAVASARSQNGYAAEVILVNDGTDQREGREIVAAASTLVDRYIEQPNRGLPAARNAGFAAATSDVVIPLDADDLLDASFAMASMEALTAHPERAFAYSDYRVFGAENYTERLAGYSLYDLLDRNVLTYSAAIRRIDWESSNGYDESMVHGYEDWEFWLNLGERGKYGQHVNSVLFSYRKHGRSLLDAARERHSELVAYIQRKHPGLYEDEGRLRVKRQWSPAVGIAASEAEVGRQTIRDWVPVSRAAEAVLPARAEAYVVPGSAQRLRSDSAELAALAVWGGRRSLQLYDGAVALSPELFFGSESNPPVLGAATRRPTQGRWERLQRHLSNAGLLSIESWRRHPFRSAARLIPLRSKERLNELCGRELFDLSFYLQFRPVSVRASGRIQQPLCYIPSRTARTPIAFVTPHLGTGGAEAVLLDIARSLDRSCYELLLLATQSQDDSWRTNWEETVDHVYDLQKLVGVTNAAAALYSIVLNWGVEILLLQNSLVGYSVLPQLKSSRPSLKTMDLIHSVDEDWNVVAATREVSGALDLRIAISDAVRRHLSEGCTPDSKVRLIRNGVDIERFSAITLPDDGIHRILFAGRLDPVKRPLLLPAIAERLRRLRSRDDFRVVVAGDGPEKAALEAEIRKRKLGELFDLRGHVEDVAPLLRECEVVVLPSRAEGIPLIVLEAFAAFRPVVASAVGAVPEVVNSNTGFCIPAGPGEVPQFAAALNIVMDQPLLRESMARSGRSVVAEQYDRRRFVADYRTLFSQISCLK